MKAPSTRRARPRACPPPARGDGPLLPEDERLAVLAHALGHPARVAIVRFLAARKECVCGRIVDRLPLAQSTVSQHLKVLKDAGLVRGTIDGPRVCYCLEPAAMRRLKSLVSAL